MNTIDVQLRYKIRFAKSTPELTRWPGYKIRGLVSSGY